MKRFHIGVSYQHSWFIDAENENEAKKIADDYLPEFIKGKSPQAWVAYSEELIPCTRCGKLFTDIDLLILPENRVLKRVCGKC